MHSFTHSLLSTFISFLSSAAPLTWYDHTENLVKCTDLWTGLRGQRGIIYLYIHIIYIYKLPWVAVWNCAVAVYCLHDDPASFKHSIGRVDPSLVWTSYCIHETFHWTNPPSVVSISCLVNPLCFPCAYHTVCFVYRNTDCCTFLF